MLHPYLDLIRTELNTYIKAKAGIDEEKVILASLGRQADEAGLANKIIMSVVDIVREEWGSTNKEYIRQGGGGYVTQSHPIHFNIHLLFSTHAKLDDELEEMKYLSLVIAFFQIKNYFDTKNTPQLQKLALDNLSMELFNLNHQEKSALWQCIGAPYAPSVLYKLSTLSVQDTEEQGIHIPEVKDIIRDIATK